MAILLFAYINASEKIDVKLCFDEVIYQPNEAVQKSFANDGNTIVWYTGESGITEKGAQFYNENIFNKFSDIGIQNTIYLYDLGAWKALRNSKASLVKISPYVKAINKLNLSKYIAVGSEDFFVSLINEKNMASLSYIHEVILKRDFIYNSSISRKPNNIKIKDVLNEAKVLAPLMDMDTSFAYSPLQYLEGIFLIKKIAQLALSSKSYKSPLAITFLLANDEMKYYKDSEKSFAEDVGVLLMQDKELVRKGLSEIIIKFVFFKYGETVF